MRFSSLVDLHPLAAQVVLLRGSEHPDRQRLEDFVKEHRAARRTTRKLSRCPFLLGLEDSLGWLTGVIGFGFAASGMQPVERHLSRPVEDAIARISGRPADRARIVEIAGVATSGAGGGRALVTALAGYLDERGCEWIVWNTTRAQRHGFTRLGVVVHELAPVFEAPRGSAAACGRSGSLHPAIVAVRLPELVRALATNARFESANGGLWLQARAAARTIAVAS